MQITINGWRWRDEASWQENQHPRATTGKIAGQFTSGGQGNADPSTNGSKSSGSLASLAEKFGEETHLNAGPVQVTGYRVGSTANAPRGVFFAGAPEDAEKYAVLHEGQSVQKYTVSAKNAAVAKNHARLFAALFPGKSFQDAIYSADKKSSINGFRKVEAKMAARLRALGHDAIIYTAPPAPAKTEIAIIEPKTARATS